MKKKLAFICILCSMMCFMVCINRDPIYTDIDEMLAFFGDELELNEKASETLSVIDTVVSEDNTQLLVLCQLHEYSAPTRYFAWQLDVIGEQKFQSPKSMHSSILEHPSSEVLEMAWDNFFLVVVNDPKVAQCKVVLQEKKYNEPIDIQVIEQKIEYIPQVLQFSISDNFTSGNMEVVVYDANGKNLR